MKSEPPDCVLITEPLLSGSSSWMAFKYLFHPVLWSEALVTFGIRKWTDLAILKQLKRKFLQIDFQKCYLVFKSCLKNHLGHNFRGRYEKTMI